MRLRLSLLAVFALAGSAAAQAPAPALKFSPIESYSVVYDMTGMQNGTLTQHSRKFGLEQSHVNDLAALAGRNQTRIISIGDRIIGYDPARRRAASTPNPAYGAFSRAAAGKTGEDLPKALLQAVQFVPTGRMQTIAGERCMVWENKTLQNTRCITADGILLESRLTRAGAPLVQTARTIRRGDAGPDDAFAVPAGVTVTEVTSMTELPGLGG